MGDCQLAPPCGLAPAPFRKDVALRRAFSPLSNAAASMPTHGHIEAAGAWGRAVKRSARSSTRRAARRNGRFGCGFALPEPCSSSAEAPSRLEGGRLSPTPFAQGVALAVGLVSALWLLPLDFYEGSSAYWRWGDAAALRNQDALAAWTALRFALWAPWGFPLLSLPGVGEPGTTAALADVLPAIALAMKAIGAHPGPEGWIFNPYGWWALAALAAAPVSAARVAHLLGARTTAGAVAAAAVASCFPPLWTSVNQVSLLGHAVFLLALELALRRASGAPRPVAETALPVAAVLLHPYLFALSAAALVGGAWSGQGTPRARAFAPLLAGVALAAATAMSIGFSPAGSGWADGTRLWGVYTMDLLAPLWPHPSLLAPGLGPVAPGTAQEYARMWPGLGGFLLAMVAVGHLAGTPAGKVAASGRGRGLLLVCLACTAFAVTTRPTLAGAPLPGGFYPEPLAPLIEVFRSSSRFFWLPLWLAVLYGAALLARPGGGDRARRAAALAAAVCLQVADTWPARTEAFALVTPPAASAVGDAESLAAALTGARTAIVIPPHDCTGPALERAARAAHAAGAARHEFPPVLDAARVMASTLEIASWAADLGLRTNSLRTARVLADCGAWAADPESARNRWGRPGADGEDLRLFVGRPGADNPQDPARPPAWVALRCRALGGSDGPVWICPSRGPDAP